MPLKEKYTYGHRSTTQTDYSGTRVAMTYIRNGSILNGKQDPIRGNHVDPLPYHNITMTTNYQGHQRNLVPDPYQSSNGIPLRQTFLSSGAALTTFAAKSSYISTNWSFGKIDIIPPGSTDTESDLKALVKLRDNQVEIGMMLADLTGSLETLFGKAVLLQHSLLSLKRGSLKGTFRNLKKMGFGGTYSSFKSKMSMKNGRWSRNLSQRWLEAQFAFIPTIKDIYVLAEVHKVGFERVAPQIYISGKGKSRRKIDDNSEKKVSDFETISYNETGTYTGITKLFAVLNDYALRTLGNVGLENPFVIAWDLLPFSFVIDWILPIGNFIKAWSSRIGLSFKNGYRSYKLDTRFNATYRYKRSTTGPNWSSFDTSTTCSGIVNGYKRVILDRLPIPNLYFKVKDLGGFHLATFTALMRQLLPASRQTLNGFR